jgi:predicted phosphoribosyltransferase
MAELSGKKTVIVVDDGLATGSSMQAAVLTLRRLRSARIIVAVPAALTETSDGAGLCDGQRHPFLRLTDGTHPLATPP